MTYKVLISKEAEIELATAECYFRVRNLHRDFLNDFKRQLEFLENTPASFQKKYREVRIVNFNQFNYSIHYVISEDKVLLLRILNQRQNF
ncbi:type II toxin-antitoxin system RelE/ParE family toxin [Autumnicola psychrophila]|uniref:Type II toxin-antitoxin system RelE/ParE family toxin n=1 Tax=Autumnicola psychrophila TaxID=3075592 RepID=A0ABU3DW82_9FLAO|nr:type II toxin-antitoxin system RelE/ParE family toxin [Zunongwangia sp. F225]MDT0687963.1 type II toxin-antitoxin system RelE/ParE family toxin [Zunongwangia sp. F225]